MRHRRDYRRYDCPCCKYPTLSELGAYQICELCNWEDDGQDDPHANEVWGGPNYTYSLSEARGNFRLYLIMYHPDKPTKRISGNGNTPLRHKTKKNMIETFDAIRKTSDSETLNTLWQSIFTDEETLKQEATRVVSEYTAKKKKERLN